MARKIFPAAIDPPSQQELYVKTTSGLLVAVIATGFGFGVATENQPGERVEMNSLPAFVKQTINQQAAGGEIVEVKREDDANGKWNYEVAVKSNGQEWGFEVDPNGKFVKKHTEIKR